MSAADAKAPRRAAAMPFIMLTVLIDMVAIGLIIPVLAPLVGTFTGDQGDHAFWYGVVTFAFGFANFWGSPVLGALSDHYGRRPVLLLGFTGLALSFLVTGLATALWMLVAIRLVSGALQATAAVAQAIVAGGRTASLYVNNFNAPARAAYLRIGFVQVGTFATVLID